MSQLRLPIVIGAHSCVMCRLAVDLLLLQNRSPDTRAWAIEQAALIGLHNPDAAPDTRGGRPM